MCWESAAALEKLGVQEVSLQDTPPKAIVETIETLVEERGAR